MAGLEGQQDLLCLGKTKTPGWKFLLGIFPFALVLKWLEVSSPLGTGDVAWLPFLIARRKN